METLDKLIQKNQCFVIYGAGDLGKLVLKYLSLAHAKKIVITDSDQSKWGKKIKNRTIISPAEVVKQYSESIFIVANQKYSKDIIDTLLSLGITINQIKICDNKREINSAMYKYLPMVYKDKYFIFDLPYQKGMKYTLTRIKNKIMGFVYLTLMNIVHPTIKKSKKYEVSICAIFKNEADYLKEWIEYHLLIGVDHFYLYNNGSNDDFKQILKPYIDREIVTLIEWPKQQAQLIAYKDCIEKYKLESRWIGFIDLDEFIVPIQDTRLYDFLRKFEKNRGSVLLYWRFFGSSGRLDRDVSGLVTEDFTVCWDRHADIGKCFYNTMYDFIPSIPQNSIFHHRLWTGYRGLVFPPVNCYGKVCFEGYNTAKSGNFPIQINHYFTKSVKEWEAKQRKGDVFFEKNPHNDAYFQLHEEKCTSIDVNIYRYLIKLKNNMNRIWSDTNER